MLIFWRTLFYSFFDRVATIPKRFHECGIRVLEGATVDARDRPSIRRSSALYMFRMQNQRQTQAEEKEEE